MIWRDWFTCFALVVLATVGWARSVFYRSYFFQKQRKSRIESARRAEERVPVDLVADVSLNTGIEWTDATWNPVKGCNKVSPGCKNCYAMRVAARFAGPADYDPAGASSKARHPTFAGFAIMKPSGPQWTGKVDRSSNRNSKNRCTGRSRARSS